MMSFKKSNSSSLTAIKERNAKSKNAKNNPKNNIDSH